ncbi:hypothetical protein ACSZMS_24415, partial [Aeromonas hydrophila]
VTLKMPAFEWVHVQLHQQKGMISLSPPTICNSAGAGPQGLWEFLQVLVRSMNTRNDFSVNYLISWYELQVPELRTLAIQRNRAVVEGIRKRLPPGAPAAAELLLHSVIAGATMQWAVDPDGELADHVLAQIAAILCLMFPEHDDFQLLQAHA